MRGSQELSKLQHQGCQGVSEHSRNEYVDIEKDIYALES